MPTSSERSKSAKEQPRINTPHGVSTSQSAHSPYPTQVNPIQLPQQQLYQQQVGYSSPVVQQPIGQQPYGQTPIGVQPYGQLAVGVQPYGLPPINQPPIVQSPIMRQPFIQPPLGVQPTGQLPLGIQPNMNSVGPVNFQDYFRNASCFNVEQQVELLEVITGFETQNKYIVRDQSGIPIFYAQEHSPTCERCCCGRNRSFKIYISDMAGRNVLTVERPQNCCFCWFGYCCTCSDGIVITSSTGQVLGHVEDYCSPCLPNYTLTNATRAPILKADGPFCTSTCCGGPVNFNLQTLNGVNVGLISKLWSGIVRELATDTDFFSITFPSDLEPEMKAVCLGLLFLIDFQYFEGSSGNSRNNSSGSGGPGLFTSIADCMKAISNISS